MKIRPVGLMLFCAEGQRDQSLFGILRTRLINDRWLDVKPHLVVLKQYKLHCWVPMNCFWRVPRCLARTALQFQTSLKHSERNCTRLTK